MLSLRKSNYSPGKSNYSPEKSNYNPGKEIISGEKVTITEKM
jgi:hypothetical protein